MYLYPQKHLCLGILSDIPGNYRSCHARLRGAVLIYSLPAIMMVNMRGCFLHCCKWMSLLLRELTGYRGGIKKLSVRGWRVVTSTQTVREGTQHRVIIHTEGKQVWYSADTHTILYCHYIHVYLLAIQITSHWHNIYCTIFYSCRVNFSWLQKSKYVRE